MAKHYKILEEVPMAKHYKILGTEVKENLSNPETIKNLVIGLVSDCGMVLLGEPQVHVVELQLQKLNKTPFEDEGGISCIGCLSTSHIAIHTWPLRETYHLDIYSCREFSPKHIFSRIKSTLGGKLSGHDLSYACEDQTAYVVTYNKHLDGYLCSSNGKQYKAKSPEMSLLKARNLDSGMKPELEPRVLEPSEYRIYWDGEFKEYCAKLVDKTEKAYGVTPVHALRQLQTLCKLIA